MPTTLLVIGDGGAPTGYARVLRGILGHLPRDAYEIHHLAVNYAGDPHDEPWKLYTAGSQGSAFGLNRVKELVERLKPQIVFSVADLWIQQLYLDEIHTCKDPPKTVVYSPVDAGPVDPEWVARFPAVNRVVAFTEYARSEILKAIPSNPPVVEVIPPGIDTETFHPLSDSKPWSTREAKQKLGLFAANEIEDSFLVLNAHRNQPRKRIDITLKAFALFAQGKPPNVQLYLHMGTIDAGWNVLKLAKRYGIDNRLILSENRVSIPGVLSEHLNWIYNACDVGINTATGEGWGLPNCEHAATGKAQIVPRFGALAEIWSEAAQFVEPSYPVVYEGVLSEGQVVAVEDVAAALERLYTDRNHRESVARSCYERATSPSFNRQAMGEAWCKVFTSAMQSSENRYGM